MGQLDPEHFGHDPRKEKTHFRRSTGISYKLFTWTNEKLPMLAIKHMNLINLLG